MKHYARFEAGEPSTWSAWEFQHPAFARPARGKLFLAERLGLTGMEISLNTFARGAAMPFLHTHREHEEVYLFLSGRGEFQVDGERVEVAPGTAVRVAPRGKRAWRNTGDAPLLFVVIQAREGSISYNTIADGEHVEGAVTW